MVADNAPRVSVVIPCYNHARYLGQAIQSVLDQTFGDVEIIVVDDGSKDDTKLVATSFGERVRYIYQSNAGLSAARNTGIRAARGESIGFLDADDVWLAEFLQTLAPILERDPGLGAVYCGSQFMDAQGARLPQTITRTFPANQLHDVLTGGEFFPPCAVLARRNVFDQVGLFDESLNASEDWDMWLSVSARYGFAGIATILALYRMHGHNMSRDLGRMLTSQLQVARKHFGSDTGDPATWDVARQRAYAAVYQWQSVAYYQRGDAEHGAEFFRRVLITHPESAHSLDTFYQCLCAEQPTGYTGDTTNFDVTRNAQRVLAVLDGIFADANISAQLKNARGAAYGLANFAAGILAYNQRHIGQARNYLMQAATHYPALLKNRQWITTFAKTCLGQRILGALLSLKNKSP